MELQAIDIGVSGKDGFCFKVFSEDFLKVDVWEFRVENPIALRLVCFLEMSKPTKRHKFRAIRAYSLWERQEGRLSIKLKDVPLTDEIKQLALKTYAEFIQQNVKIMEASK